jgi:hypothetical protein
VNAFHQVFQWPPQLFLDGWPYLGEFYSLLWAPLGLVALLAPELILPGVALVFLHMTIPWGHGVDRSWGGHIHHMGPALPFFVAGAIVGTSRLVAWTRRFWTVPRPATVLLSSTALLFSLNWDLNWSNYYNLRLNWTSTQPTYTHPVWTLVQDHLTPEDVPIVSSRLSLAVSARTRSFSFDESLFDKAPNQGLTVGTHLIVDQRNTAVVKWGMAMTGATTVASAGPYHLIEWTKGALDKAVPVSAPQVLQDTFPWEGMPLNRTRIDGVPPRTTPPPPPGLQQGATPQEPFKVPQQQ